MLLNAYHIHGCDLCEILDFFTIFQKCETRYETVYEEQCQTVNEQQCATVNEQQCSTVQARLPTDIPRILDSLDALFPFGMCCGDLTRQSKSKYVWNITCHVKSWAWRSPMGMCCHWAMLWTTSNGFTPLICILFWLRQEEQCNTVNEQQCSTINETVYEDECTTVNEEKCEIQYMTKYEQQCSSVSEQVFSNDLF